MKKIICYLLLGLVSILTYAPVSKAQHKPIPIIFDADMGPMVDDVAAIAVLHALSAKDEAKILATIGNNRYPGAAQVFDVFNTYYGDPKIPIGLPNPANGPVIEKKDAPKLNILGGWTNKIVKKFPTDIRSNKLVPTAVEVYRKVLSKQPNHSVTIVTTGFLTNLSNLLISQPDKYSKLTGEDLIKKKVNKLVCMAGTFTGPVSDPQGPHKEYNLYMDAKASKHVFETWPTKIIFDGFALGAKVKIGYPLISNNKIKKDPVKYVFKMELRKSRSGFDPIAVLVAVRGAKPYFNLIPGHITVKWVGSNGWDSTKTGQYYLKEKPGSISKIENTINTLMQYTPSK